MRTARFDDLRPRRRRSFELHGHLATLVARAPAQVLDVLGQADRATRAGRWVAGWVSYEAAPAFDPALRVRDVAATVFEDLPLACFGVFETRRPAAAEPDRAGYRLGPWAPSIPESRHARDVETILDRIRNGDTYQVNHTLRLTADFDGDPAALYRDLCGSQNTAYGAHLRGERWAIVSVSPELFFEWRHGRLVSRPMKGTTRRGVDLTDDETHRSWLERSEKNRAENLMIVDMVRNDMGRIARTGSVRVPAMFTTEKYDTVWQLTSTVESEPRPGLRLADVFEALFPSASITGAPKVATMDIIAALETDPRGAYCGAIGFGGPGPGGEAHWVFNVGIRTAVLDLAAGIAVYGTGGGITYDSTPADEYQEALLKTEVLSRRSADFELLETIRWEPASGFHRLDLHLRRLAESADYFDVPLDEAEVRAALDQAVATAGSAQRLRLLVGRTGWVSVAVDPLESGADGLLRLAVDDRPVDPGDPFLHHKTTRRRVYREAAARHPHADDVILVNDRGEATETTIGNLAVEIDGRWVTPPTSSGCLAGTERSALLAAGELAERPVTIEELISAPRLARVNSVRGWQNAVLVQET